MTLPTRPDGGIDWRGFVLRVCVDQRDYTVFLIRPTPEYKLGEEARLSYLYPHEIGPTIAAHTRERCAKVAKNFALMKTRSDDDQTFAGGYNKACNYIAAAIEEMED